MNFTTPTQAGGTRLRVCAVSYLNTDPLVWGMLHGPQRGVFDLSFAVPSICADRVQAQEADIGLVPCAELDRLQLGYLSDVGIACRGPVRSILLISKCPPAQIRTLAADSSSRTSVMLARIVVAERYGVTPQLISMPPDLDSMLETSDAALIIGDPALAVKVSELPWNVLDLGGEWVALTGLPMVFAVWAGRPDCLNPEVGRAFAESCRFGIDRIQDVIENAVQTRRVRRDLARKYLTEHIVFELGSKEREGLELFRSKVAELQSRDQNTANILVP